MRENLSGYAAGGPVGQPVPPWYPAPRPPAAPYTPTRWPTWRIVDMIATIVLFTLYGVALLGLLYFSVFWVMATDSCGASDCDYDKLSAAYVLNDLVGGVVFLVTLVVAVVLLVRRTPAFWLPLLGGAVQVGLFLAAMHQLSGVSPA
ncbi:DUF6264 family protein [Tsukamurella paurometabola]|uniref:DUF6264 family protein n=1 Tax=Tsukamurella paurometabola TaxID=2061 RepID=UPI000F7ECB54|nr:DUF6264 family protein [Tsukamurella paurometabola]UEA82236.1 DUF6264 family protein [Tsukamurella paurometabola]